VDSAAERAASAHRFLRQVLEAGEVPLNDGLALLGLPRLRLGLPRLLRAQDTVRDGAAWHETRCRGGRASLRSSISHCASSCFSCSFTWSARRPASAAPPAVDASIALAAAAVSLSLGSAMPSPGRHCHSTPSLTVIDCHSFGIHRLILLSLLSFSGETTVSPSASDASLLELGLQRRHVAAELQHLGLQQPRAVETFSRRPAYISFVILRVTYTKRRLNG
jgi:hypothetical protein